MIPGAFGGFAPRYFIGRPMQPAFAYPSRAGWGAYGVPPNYLSPVAYGPSMLPTWRYPAASLYWGMATPAPWGPPSPWGYAYPPMPAYPYGGVPYPPYGGMYSYPYRMTYSYPYAMPSAIVMPVQVVPPVPPPWYNPSVTPTPPWPAQAGTQAAPVQAAPVQAVLATEAGSQVN